MSERHLRTVSEHHVVDATIEAPDGVVLVVDRDVPSGWTWTIHQVITRSLMPADARGAALLTACGSVVEMRAEMLFDATPVLYSDVVLARLPVTDLRFTFTTPPSGLRAGSYGMRYLWRALPFQAWGRVWQA